MARKKKKPLQPSLPREEQAAEAATVCWVLATLACLLGQILHLAVWGITSYQQLDEGTRGVLITLGAIFLMIALITSLLVIVLTILVRRMRITKPAPSVIAVTLGIAASAWVIFVLHRFLG